MTNALTAQHTSDPPLTRTAAPCLSLDTCMFTAYAYVLDLRLGHAFGETCLWQSLQ